MKVLMTKWFTKFMHREDISLTQICKAVHDISLNKIDAHYGGNVIKQRIPRTNSGKSGGYRTIVLYQTNNKAFFVYGFSKSDRDNIDTHEVQAFKDMARTFLDFSDAEIARLVNTHHLKEVNCHEKL